MAKIKIELKVPDSEYCDCETRCPMLEAGFWAGEYRCSFYDSELEVDKDNGYYFKRCEQCKQAEADNHEGKSENKD